MVVKVVDASAIAALLFDEPGSEAVFHSLLDASLVAPALLQFELANVCLKKLGRRPAEREAITAAFAKRGRLGMEEVQVEHDGVVRLAAVTGLSAYDASYLWLAWRLGVELVTLDKRLAKVAAGASP
jgi:predicted nucleic acid-binding protein